MVGRIKGIENMEFRREDIVQTYLNFLTNQIQVCSFFDLIKFRTLFPSC